MFSILNANSDKAPSWLSFAKPRIPKKVRGSSPSPKPKPGTARIWAYNCALLIHSFLVKSLESRATPYQNGQSVGDSDRRPTHAPSTRARAQVSVPAPGRSGSMACPLPWHRNQGKVGRAIVWSMSATVDDTNTNPASLTIHYTSIFR